MESIYYVITWLCHRACRHCYEDRFHPYHGSELQSVVAESQDSYRKIIGNFPDRMKYQDLASPLPGGGFVEKTGTVILAGGEVLVDPIRESVLYPALDLLHERYEHAGGVKLVVQTTGDLVTEQIVRELLAHHVWLISVSGMDAYHVGLEKEPARLALKEKLTRIFEDQGMRHADRAPQDARNAGERGAFYHFFGATPEEWIGKLWPRGRAFTNQLSTATVADNFCNRWSGGLNFLAHGFSGAEVSVEPNGNVYPCCLKTKLAIGNLKEEKLTSLLDRLVGDPVYEAISMGHPERMGIRHGVSVQDFLEKSRTTLPSGQVYQNLCIGCDRFHEEVLIPLKARKG
jgi:sulfatase maturation enzyme AslB (radical SAM superfamily)